MTTILRCRINKSAVDRLEPGEMIRDSELKGFGVRRQKGDPVYFLQKRVKGAPARWVTIGTHGSPWTPDSARKEALRLLHTIATGVDPNQQREVERAKLTVNQGSELFMAEHGTKLKKRTREEYQRLFKLYILPTFGARRIDDITRTEISRFHSRMAATPAMANFALAVLSKLMTWAAQQGFRTDATNPCRGITKYRPNKLERYLSSTEFARLGQVLDQLERDGEEGPFVLAAIRLLLLTGARLNEILTLEWAFVDLERDVLRLPDSKTGRKTIRLGPAAAAVLRDLPRVKGNPFVIVGRREGANLINLQKPWRRIRELAGLEDVRIHDLRHSFASMAAASGASLPMIGKLLGHSQPQTTARYAHLADDPLHRLNQKVDDLIAGALHGQPDSEPE